VASFDETILPGEGGKIILSIQTEGYEGLNSWSAKVNTNDPVMREFHIELKAFINVPVFVSSRYIYLKAPNGQLVTREIEIKTGMERPLLLEPEKFNLEGRVTYKIEEIEKGRKFRVLFTHIPGSTGNYKGFLQLKTNIPEEPIVTITIMGGSGSASRKDAIEGER
jgi:hypothetical protein